MTTTPICFRKLLTNQLEVNTQRGYVSLVDQMVTHTTVVTANAQTSSLVKDMRKASSVAHKTLDKMVSNQLHYNC